MGVKLSDHLTTAARLQNAVLNDNYIGFFRFFRAFGESGRFAKGEAKPTKDAREKMRLSVT